MRGGRGPAPVRSAVSPLLPGEARDSDDEQELRTILAGQGLKFDDVVVVNRPVASDPASLASLRSRPPRLAEPGAENGDVLIAAIHRTGGDWLVARVFQRPGFETLVLPLIWQTVLIYVVVVGAVWFILRRISRPLAALTRRLDSFSRTRSLDGQLSPEGPADVRSLIEAHNRWRRASPRCSTRRT